MSYFATNISVCLILRHVVFFTTSLAEEDGFDAVEGEEVLVHQAEFGLEGAILPAELFIAVFILDEFLYH